MNGDGAMLCCRGAPWPDRVLARQVNGDGAMVWCRGAPWPEWVLARGASAPDLSPRRPVRVSVARWQHQYQEGDAGARPVGHSSVARYGRAARLFGGRWRWRRGGAERGCGVGGLGAQTRLAAGVSTLMSWAVGCRPPGPFLFYGP